MGRVLSFNPEVARKLHGEYVRVLQELERDQSVEVQYLTRNEPSREHLHSLIEEAFWASLERVEGRHHRFTIAICPKESVGEPFLFTKAIPLHSETLAKLSPAVGAESTAIGVWPEANELIIWGLCPKQMSEKASVRRLNEQHRPLVKVVDAGQIIFEFDSFPHAAYSRELITATDAKSIEMYAGVILNALWRAYPSDRADELQQELDFGAISKRMRSHGHGGTLLIVPQDFDNNQSVEFMAYPSAPFERPKKSPVTEFIGHLTAIDGATMVTVDLTVRGFGGKIKLEDRPTEVSEHFIYQDQGPELKDVSTFHWGMRHFSALQFIHGRRDQRLIAIVASQDGGLTVFQWSTDEEIVYVTRHVEYALL
jgi:sensor domain DACNV-containing protein